GRDGRVRVTDFGLARWGQASSGGPSSASLSVPILGRSETTDPLRLSSTGARSPGEQLSEPSPVVSLTETGSLVGTPAYMAPEQYEHRTADAAADQFAFCVALYDAIHGGRPFAGRTVAELASN